MKHSNITHSRRAVYLSLNLSLDVVAFQVGIASVPPESEMFVNASHPGTVLEGLNRLRLNGVLCDVILCCEGQEFPCHRHVLASISSYFEVNLLACCGKHFQFYLGFQVNQSSCYIQLMCYS